MKSKKPTICSLFAGIGGIELAFEQAGFKTVWANEIDKYACRTYRLNFPQVKLVEGDIRDIDASTIPHCDVLTAGFPCQTFSSVGLQKGFDDERGNLFFEIVRVLAFLKPRLIFFENVSNLEKHDSGRTFLVIKKELAKLGYTIAYKVMNSSDYGVPQQRNRIYIIGSLCSKDVEKFSFPDPTPLKHDAFYYLSKERQLESYYLDRHKRWAEIKEAVVDPKRIYRFTDWGFSKSREGICPTLLAAMGSTQFERIPFFLDGHSIRKITQSEAAALQGFPKTFQFDYKAPKQVYKQIGNSVCVPVVKMIALGVKTLLSEKQN